MKKINGLTNEEVVSQRELFGTNKIAEPEDKKFHKELWNTIAEDDIIKLLIGVTIIMGVLALFNVSDWAEPLTILCSVSLVSVMGTKTTMTSEKRFKKLKETTSKTMCTVWRNGERVLIDTNNLVVGDHVIVQSGEKIYADGYLFEGAIKVDNSALNGESEEVKKTGANFDTYAFSQGDMTDKHTLLRGALVVDGEGVMVVTLVGGRTMMGKMAEEMNEEPVPSPLQVKLSNIAELISKVGYVLAVSIGIIHLGYLIIEAGGMTWFSQGALVMFQDVLDSFLLAITIAVMAVPEGLPLMISLVLGANVNKMYKANVIVRNSIGIETAGSLNVLYSDKTGTITKGQLEVVNFIDNEGNQYDKIDKLDVAVQQLVSTSLHINNSAMVVDGVITGGNNTDRALLQYVKDIEFEDLKVVKKESFNSAKKFMATQVETPIGRTLTLYKGAVEKVLDKCINISDEQRNKINGLVDDMANSAIRVLAIGYAHGELVEGELSPEMCLLGVVGIRDDVRPEAKTAIKDVQDAGVQVAMITGDRKETAVAIAKDSGLIKSDSDVVLTSAELQEMSDDEVKTIIPNLRVVARALPTDKSRLVRLSQELGLVVGMTGDGVNDSPALKRADVGFAMGSGTDSAKEAGDIIITDDNFASIAKSILYGRTIYNNILKFLKFQLAINVTAVTVCTIAPFLGIKEPLTVVQILLLNLIMDSLGAMALGAEPALKEYMKEKPKQRTQSLITKDMAIQIGVTGLFMVVMSFVYLLSGQVQKVMGLAHLTGYFNLFVFMAIFNGFNVRSNGANIFKGLGQNPMFAVIMAIIALVQVVLTTFGGEYLSVVPMSATQWVVSIGLAMIVIPFGILLKAVTKKLK